jgi:phage terminase large subunit-like protein
LFKNKWNDAFLDEHESFPTGTYKDQVDAAAGAFAQLVNKKYAYDTSMRWAEHL